MEVWCSARPDVRDPENLVAPGLHLLPQSAVICALVPRISARRRTLEGTLDVDTRRRRPNFMHTIYTETAKTSVTRGVVTARWVANPTSWPGEFCLAVIQGLAGVRGPHPSPPYSLDPPTHTRPKTIWRKPR